MPMSSKGEVEVSRGVTLNMGNYESARLDVAIRIPVEDNESIQHAIDRATQIASTEIMNKMDEFKAAVKSRGEGGY